MTDNESELDELEFIAEHRTKPLNPSKIPKGLHPLISFAEKWGVTNVVAQGMILDRASAGTLEEIIQTVDLYSPPIYE